MKTYNVTIDLSQFIFSSNREVSRTVTVEAETKGDAIRKALSENQYSVHNQIYCKAVEA